MASLCARARPGLRVGGGQISRAKRMRTGGPDSDAQSWSSIQKARRKRIKLLNCEVCKFGFRGARSDVRFCSSACRQWSYRARRLGGGGAPISSAVKGRTGGPGSYPKSSIFLKGKAQLVKGAQVAGHLAETSGHLVRKRRFLRRDPLVMALSGGSAELPMTPKKAGAPCRPSRCPRYA